MSDGYVNALIGAVATVLIGLLTGFVTSRVAKNNNRAAPYDKLAARVDHLESQAEEHTREIAFLRRGLTRWDVWWDDLSYNWQIHRTRDEAPPRPDCSELVSPSRKGK